MYVSRNIEANSCNHYRGKAISIAYSEYVFVAYAMRMRHIFICGLSSPTILFHIIS